MKSPFLISRNAEKIAMETNRREVIVLVGLLSADHNLIRIIKIFIG